MAGNPNPRIDHLTSTQYKPGQSGHPGGRSRYWMTKERLQATLSEMMQLPTGEIRAILSDDTANALDQMIAAIIVKAIDRADAPSFEFLLQRCLGKVQDLSVVEVKQWSDDLKTISLESIKQLAKEKGTE